MNGPTFLASPFSSKSLTITRHATAFAVNYYVHQGLRFMWDVIVPNGPDAHYGGTIVHTRANIRF